MTLLARRGVGPIGRQESGRSSKKPCIATVTRSEFNAATGGVVAAPADPPCLAFVPRSSQEEVGDHLADVPFVNKLRFFVDACPKFSATLGGVVATRDCLSGDARDDAIFEGCHTDPPALKNETQKLTKS